MTIDAPLLLRAAAAAAGSQQFATAALYVVATPIGNLADLTLRAIHILARVDAVAAEDTRVAGALLHHLGLSKPLVALHAHNEAQAAQAVLVRLAAGEAVALVSDAGTPAISDPGAVLVQAATAAGHRVLPVPGASSAAAAVSVAGDTLGHGFSFAGFLPAKGQERQAALAALLGAGTTEGPSTEGLSTPGRPTQGRPTQVLFEAPHRIEALADALAAAAPARRVTVCRELTKQFETVATMACSALPAWQAADANRRRGEFVLVLHAVAPPAAAALPAGAERTLDLLLAELPLKQAVALAAAISGAPRNALYNAALAKRDP